MLDDTNIIKQRDPNGALEIASTQYQQAAYQVNLQNVEHDGRPIHNIVVAGMGGSALAALITKVWLKYEINIPFEIIRGYNVAKYVGSNTLVIASSYSGDTEETVNCLKHAQTSGAQLAIITSGGKLMETAKQSQITYAVLPTNFQPRMAVIYNLRALIALLVNFKLVENDKFSEIADTSDWLMAESAKWGTDIPTNDNYAKQLALKAVGKTAVFYGGPLTAPVAYKWKISWNENAKNLAFWNEYPEFNHNEFIGWTSHPVEKPFAIFDIIGSIENDRILERFEISDRLLSGMRPKSTVVNLAGNTPIEQMLWGCILADFVSIYVAILNNVNPMPVQLIEKLKTELAEN
ncbi:MAG: bifunctional phosphoglucose/phosphomannose isomerase [Candidatus Saccharibacteria bacterium]|nr:bifunctional phosphoglucose/phosphomannose isomerase [Candidatus Saccharibacteria bacterium]